MTQEVIEQQQQETAVVEATEQVQQTEAKAEGEQGTAAATEQEEKPQGAEGEQQTRDERGRFKPGVQQRIDELTRQRHEAEREAAYWRERAGVETTKAQASASAAPKPTPDKFNDYGEYVEALADWKAEEKVVEALAKRDQESAERAQQTAQQAKASTFAERQTAARAEIADYDDVMAAAAEVRIASHVHEAVLDSEFGPAIAYHLAKNPDEAERLSGLSPMAAAREIGRLEASLGKTASASPAPKPVSKAPAPIKPIGAGATTSSNSDPSKMGMDEYVKWRKAQGATWAR